MKIMKDFDYNYAHKLLDKIVAKTKERDKLDQSKAYSPISPLIIYQALVRADKEIADLMREYNDLMDMQDDQLLNREEDTNKNIQPTTKTMTIKEFLEYDPVEIDPEKRKWKEIQRIYNNL